MRRSFVNEEEIGRIVDKRHFDTICKFYDDSVSSIAEVIIGGRDKFREDIRFIPPTVLRMRDTTCPLMTEELFSADPPRVRRGFLPRRGGAVQRTREASFPVCPA